MKDLQKPLTDEDKKSLESLSHPIRLGIMMVLAGADILYKEYGVVSGPGDKSIRLDEEGKRVYGQMLEEGTIDFSRLEGHYRVLEKREPL